MRIVTTAVQDQLFPRGQWSRRLISWVARIIHPTEVRSVCLILSSLQRLNGEPSKIVHCCLITTTARLPAVALDVGRRSAAGSRHSAVLSALRVVLAACVVQLLDARHRLPAAAVDTAAQAAAQGGLSHAAVTLTQGDFGCIWCSATKKAAACLRYAVQEARLSWEFQLSLRFCSLLCVGACGGAAVLLAANSDIASPILRTFGT
jgi:hypothetical protein